jgi:predicted dehydrogenase
MRSLIIGMNIGQLYKKVLTKLNIDTVTVDLNLSADYRSYHDAVNEHKFFDTIHICTPNYTHEVIARDVVKFTKFLFIEKPGFETEHHWHRFVKEFPNTNIMMVKNNMWRDNIDYMKEMYKNSNTINLNWLNLNRIPSPGSWFTNKKLAFGGVSRDLLPHLFSLYAALEPDYQQTSWTYKTAWQRWNLQQLTDSDYGTINQNGVFDVDDHVELSCKINNKLWFIRSSWRNMSHDDIAIYFNHQNVTLGLCPESAYYNMINHAIENESNRDFWHNQFELDCWIHRNINL